MKTNEILNELKKLKIEFCKIQCKNWIPSKSQGFGAAGRTLEILLHKPEDQLPIADYHGIELKTKIEGSEPYIGLFSMALDNKPLEMQRLLNLGGYLDKNFKQFKVFQASVWGNFAKMIGPYYYRLKVDYPFKVVRLLIFNGHGQLIEKQMSWSFEQLQKRLEEKLQYLAFFKVKRWNLDGNIYFKYTDMKLYQLKDFAEFLNLIEKGIVRVTFKLSFFRQGENFGKVHDRGTTFEIKDYNLEKLFDCIDL